MGIANSGTMDERSRAEAEEIARQVDNLGDWGRKNWLESNEYKSGKRRYLPTDAEVSNAPAWNRALRTLVLLAPFEKPLP